MRNEHLPKKVSKSIVDLQRVIEEAERAARSTIFKKVMKSQVADLDIVIDTPSLDPLTIDVRIGVELRPSVKGIDVNALVKEATDNALQAADEAIKTLGTVKT